MFDYQDSRHVDYFGRENFEIEDDWREDEEDGFWVEDEYDDDDDPIFENDIYDEEKEELWRNLNF